MNWGEGEVEDLVLTIRQKSNQMNEIQCPKCHNTFNLDITNFKARIEE